GLVRALIAEHAILCDVVPGHIAAAAKASHARHLSAYAEHLAARYGYSHGRYVPRDEMPSLIASERYFGGYFDSDAFHLHPLSYALGLAQAAETARAKIFENTRVIGIDRGKKLRLSTSGGSVECEFAVVAGNGYIEGLVPDIE